MNIQNIIELKQENVKSIIRCIRSDDLTKKEISQRTGLSFATVSNVCNELKEKEIVKEIDVTDSRNIGRNPKIITLCHNNYFILCLDLHIKNLVKMALLSLKNEILSELCVETEQYSNIDEIISFCYKKFEEMICAKALSKNQIIGIGVIVSGIFDNETETIVGSQIELFENQPLKSMLSQTYNLPIYINNESNLCAAAMQSIRNNSDLLYLYASEGLGIGIISQGILIGGKRGYGAEICHIPIGNPNYQCRFCNSYGCVETDLSVYGFIAKYTGNIDYDKSKVFKKWYSFIKSLKQKEPNAIKTAEENSLIFGRLLSVLVNLFDPEVIYIGGEIIKIFDELYPIIRTEINKRMVVKNAREIPIKADYNSEKSMISGAAEVVFNSWNPI